jgi:hypothetical protein
MQTPYRLDLESLEDLGELCESHIAECYTRKGEEYICKSCGATILRIGVHISLHISEWDRCAGPGVISEVDFLYYCPNCEEKPKKDGCVHLPLEVLRPFMMRIELSPGPRIGLPFPRGY